MAATTSHDKLTESLIKLRSGHYDLETVRTLNASHLGLKSMEGIALCANVETLDLSRNRLPRLAEMRALSRLVVLHLESNCLESVRGLGTHPSLRELYLGGNVITTVAALSELPGACPALVRLDVRDLSGKLSNPVCAVAGYADAVRALLPTLRVHDGQRLAFASVYNASALRDLFLEGECFDLPSTADPWCGAGFWPSVDSSNGGAGSALAPTVEVASFRALLAKADELDSQLRQGIARVAAGAPSNAAGVAQNVE